MIWSCLLEQVSQPLPTQAATLTLLSGHIGCAKQMRDQTEQTRQEVVAAACREEYDEVRVLAVRGLREAAQLHEQVHERGPG